MINVRQAVDRQSIDGSFWKLHNQNQNVAWEFWQRASGNTGLLKVLHTRSAIAGSSRWSSWRQCLFVLLRNISMFWLVGLDRKRRTLQISNNSRPVLSSSTIPLTASEMERKELLGLLTIPRSKWNCQSKWYPSYITMIIPGTQNSRLPSHPHMGWPSRVPQSPKMTQLGRRKFPPCSLVFGF